MRFSPFRANRSGVGRVPAQRTAPEVKDLAVVTDLAVDPGPQVVSPFHTVQIGDIALQVLADTKDRDWYQQRKAFEEHVSLLYRLIGEEGFESFVDIGANVGFISVLARRSAPGVRVVAVEADPRLVPLIRENLAANGVPDATVVHARLGEADGGDATFSLNPSSTLDNRVDIQQWEKVEVPSRSMDSLLQEHGVTGRTFFKVDTQGYEQRVLLGLADRLASSSDWMLKMEFAPNWLVSQGTEPEELLAYLLERYEVAEYAERIPYGTDSLDALFAFPLTPDRIADFVGYVRSLNKHGLGWVDLIVRPRG